jgi:hypothetical protein
LIDRCTVGLDGALVVLPLGLVKGCLRLVDFPLALLALPLPRCLLLPAPRLFSLEGKRRLPLCFSVALPGRMFFALDRSFVGLRLPSPGKSVGSWASSLKGPSEPTGRLRTTPGFAMVAATMSGRSVSFATPW